MGRIEIAGCLD